VVHAGQSSLRTRFLRTCTRAQRALNRDEAVGPNSRSAISEVMPCNVAGLCLVVWCNNRFKMQSEGMAEVGTRDLRELNNRRETTAHLCSALDEYFVAYKDRQIAGRLVIYMGRARSNIYHR
jgi:hypothetical protein